ncbi:lipoyl(octanoyl) transferase, partial [Citrobacter sp. AAK_AS5]
CGYEGLKTIRMKDFGIDASVDAVGECLLGHLQRLLPPVPPSPPAGIGETDNANPPAEPAVAARAGS